MPLLKNYISFSVKSRYSPTTKVTTKQNREDPSKMVKASVITIFVTFHDCFIARLHAASFSGSLFPAANYIIAPILFTDLDT
jgi:hypothetical protein